MKTIELFGHTISKTRARRLARLMYEAENRREREQIKAPLYACDRVRYNDDDTRTEYGFFVGTGWTDDEIKEELELMKYEINSPYDCTGRPYTIIIKWHRNPSGLISYVHWIGYDY